MHFILEGNIKNNSIPNLFVIGSPKAGTSAFVDGLSQVDSCFVPSLKEPRFFDAHIFYDFKVDFPLNSEEYFRLYKSEESKSSSYRIDGSVFNMYSMDSIRNILSISPEAKFILLVRDPVASVKSMYLQRLKYSDSKMREISKIFSECWDKFEARKNGDGYPAGCRNKFLFRYDLLYSYELYIPLLRELIPKKNLLLIKYESFRKNSNFEYQKTFEFLSLSNVDMPKSREVNTSNIKKTGLINYWIETLIFKTSKIRRGFGINGRRVTFIKGIVTGFSREDKITIDIDDEEIRKKFVDTYVYLEKLAEEQAFGELDVVR